MNDEQKQPFLEAWFSDREVAPENVKEGVAQVMSEVPRTRQHGRWMPLPLHRPKATSFTPSTTDTTEYQPSPNPASNGHAPTVIGRTSSMLTPVKAITAGAIVFAIGGAFLIAQPLEQQAGVPGAAIDPCTTPIAHVAGDIIWGSQQPGVEAFESNGATHLRRWVFNSAMEVDDDRLDGTTTGSIDWDYTSLAGVNQGTFSVENEDGTWEGTWKGIGRNTTTWQAVTDLTGTGAYEGLSARLFIRSGPTGPINGSVYPTDLATCDFSTGE